MPMLIPFIYFVVYGIQQILNKFIKNKRVEKNIIILISILIIMICVYCLFGIIIPYYNK